LFQDPSPALAIDPPVEGCGSWILKQVQDDGRAVSAE
jgi:hypothetical protein